MREENIPVIPDLVWRAFRESPGLLGWCLAYLANVSLAAPWAEMLIRHHAGEIARCN